MIVAKERRNGKAYKRKDAKSNKSDEKNGG